jgi:flagellar biogenesis protein FliO
LGDGLSLLVALGDALGLGVGVTALATSTRIELTNRTMIVLVSFMEESFLLGIKKQNVFLLRPDWPERPKAARLFLGRLQP